MLAEAVLCPGLEIKSQTPLGQGGACILTMTSPIGNLAAAALFDYLEPPVRSDTMIGSTIDITYSHLFPRWSSLFPVPGGSACALTLAKISPFPAPRKGNKGFRKVTRKFSASEEVQVSQLCRAYEWTVKPASRWRRSTGSGPGLLTLECANDLGTTLKCRFWFGGSGLAPGIQH